MSMAIETNQAASVVLFMALKGNTEGLFTSTMDHVHYQLLLSVGTISNTVFVVYFVTLIYVLQGQLQTQC